MDSPIDLCPRCRRLFDHCLKEHGDKRLYLELNQEAPAPENFIVIRICNDCRTNLAREIPADGLTVINPP